MASEDQQVKHLSDVFRITVNVDDIDASSRIIETDALPASTENPEDSSLPQSSTNMVIPPASGDGCASSRPSTQSSSPSDSSPLSSSDPDLQPPDYSSTSGSRSVIASRDFKIFNEEYKMDHARRGICLIFNHEVFDDAATRAGTEFDAYTLQKCFKHLGFDVHRFDNLCYYEIREKLVQFSSSDHSDADCFCCCFLTHGEDGELILARDQPYDKRSVYELFNGENCKTLAGKPKIFLIQACRGRNSDPGVSIGTVLTDSVTPSIPPAIKNHKIHSMADFLISHSTVEGYYSYRNTITGGWFVQSLVPLLKDYATDVDLLTILTRVNNVVNLGFEAVPSGKQVPETAHTLTKKLVFRRKPQQQELTPTQAYRD